MRPADFWYYLTLQYRVRETCQRIRFTAGPLAGTVEDEFGQMGLLLLEAVLHVPGEGSAAFYLPRSCRDDGGPLLEVA